MLMTALSLVLALPLLAALAAPVAAQEAGRIRLGWQTNWAIQTHIAQVLIRTDILERNGLNGAFTEFSYGGPLNAAMLANEVDVGFAGDMPATTQVARGADIDIVARLVLFRGAIMVSPESPVKKVGDLKGKTLAGAVGSSIHRQSVTWLTEAGLAPGRDMQLINIAAPELADAVKAKKIDALFTWDPWIALFEKRGVARVVAETPTLLGVVVMQRAYSKANPKAAVSFLKAYKQAVYFMARNHDLVNKWHQEAARLPETETIAIAAAYDPNWKASRWEDVNVTITPSDLATLKATASFAHDQKLTKTLADHDRAVNHDLLKRAEAEMVGKPFDPKTVKVVKP